MIRIFRKIVSVVFFLAAFCLNASAQSQGNWPIKGLELTGPANGGSYDFTNLNRVVAQNVQVSNLYVNSLVASNVVSSNVYTKSEIEDLLINSNEWNTAYEWVNINSNGVLYLFLRSNAWDVAAAEANFASNGVVAIADKTFGNEGIRRVGALGGYTLEGMLKDTSVRGASRDLPIFSYTLAPSSNLVVSWSSGDVYSPENGYFHLIAGTNTLVNNAVNYAYWTLANPAVISWTTGTRAPATNCIALGTFSCSFGMIINAGDTVSGCEMPILMDEAHYNVMPSLIAYGLDYSATGTNFNQIIQNTGVEFHNLIEKNIHPAKNLTNGNILITYFHTNSNWSLSSTNYLPVDSWDNGTNLVSCTLSNWYRGLFISSAGSTNMGWVYPQTEYTNYADALAADDPSLPMGFDPYTPRCTAYIFQGGDTNLRTDGIYWLDRRFMIRRGSITTGGGGGGSSSTVPTLYQVLLQGNGTGGILPNGAGRPSQPDQLANKDYVDSTVNNINAHQAYVDGKGNDGTALIESSILPFKTIQAAIDAASLVAATTNRFVVRISPGIYTENITMKNFISLRGEDIESTIISGTITYPPAFIDEIGAEIALLTIQPTNATAFVINMGSDLAYMGVRSCYLNTTYNDPVMTNKSVILYQRGVAEIYGTSYLDLEITTTNGPISKAQIFEHKTDPANPGLSQLMSFGNSCVINSYDVNDEIALVYSHDNTDTRCINTVQAGIFNVHLDLVDGIYSNNFKIISHKGATGRTLAQGIVSRLYLPVTNSCNLFMGYCDSGTGDNVTILRNNHIRVVSGATSNIWLGAAITTNDTLRVIDTEFVQDLSDYPYPKVYTNSGAAGKFFINTPHANGDHLFGSAIDVSTVNSTAVSLPATGHLKLYANAYAGKENLMFKDSSGNIGRYARDNFYNGYNADTTDMQVGQPVYICAGLSADNTPKVKRSISSDPSTMPAIGVVAQVGGVTTGSVGRIMYFGRLEQGMDTSAFASGDKLYVSSTFYGLTNVAPSGSNIVQQIGTCHIVGTNGYVNVRPWGVDMLGGLYPIDYVTKSWAASNTNNINAWKVGGFTSSELTAGSVTYYQWGSLAGPVTNPASRLIQLASPALENAWTNTFNLITNGWTGRGVSINPSENPDTLVEGMVTFYPTLLRTGDNSPRMVKAVVTVLESNMVTIVAQYTASDIVQCPNDMPTTIPIGININSSVQIKSRNRYILIQLVACSGWTGTESISFYSQDSYLTRVVLPGGSLGIYASQTDLINETNRAIQAESAISVIATWASNNTVGVSNNWYGSVAYLITSGDTQRWNNAYNTAVSTSNDWYGSVAKLIVSADTQRWNIAGLTATWASNNTVGVSNNWYGSVAKLITSGDTQRWNNAYNTAVSTSNDWYGSVAKLIVSADTQRWNNAYEWVNINSNSIQNGTGNWNTAYNWVNANSNRLTRNFFKAGMFTNSSYPNSVVVTNFYMTNLVAISGMGNYNSSLSRWYPNVTNRTIILRGAVYFGTTVNGKSLYLYLYKNGTNYTTLGVFYAPNAAADWGISWAYVDTVNTSTNDYYEVWVSSPGTSATFGAGTNNWWYGESD